MFANALTLNYMVMCQNKVFKISLSNFSAIEGTKKP